MDVFLKGEQSEASNDRHPLLMEGQAEHAIDIPRGNSSVSNEHNIRDSSRSNHDNRILLNSHIPDSQSSSSSSSPTILHSRNTAVSRRSDGYDRRRRSPLNSGLWVSIELFVYISQIIAAIIVLSLSRNEHPKAPLFEWVIGYTVGCFATLPHLYWRYINGNNQGTGEDSAHRRQESNQNSSNEQAPYASVSVTQIPEAESQSASGSSSNSQDSATVNPRLRAFVDHFKMGLDCFFAVWFVVGNVWIFGGHSSASESPNLYRLCIVFLTFSCIGYAMPFVLCATICCCLPCIISILGLREELTPQLRGASPELLGALPTYKFKSKGGGEANSEGGIVAFGTDKERVISPDDAICCICLAKYADGDELRELSCGHFFHKVCVDKWLKINALCPLCKAEVSGTTGSGH